MHRLTLAIVALLLFGWAVLHEVQQRWEQPLAIPPEGFVMSVAAGDSLRAVANRLHAQGYMPYPNLLILYGRWSGLDQQIKRGEYLLPQGTTALSLLNLLHSGKVVQYQVTLPEGITLAQALSILRQEDALENVITDEGDTRIMQLVLPRVSAEGLFFPDSYRYSRGDSDWQVLLQSLPSSRLRAERSNIGESSRPSFASTLWHMSRMIVARGSKFL